MTDELTQGVKDAQAKFDAGMGADGDASPYPMLKELRAKAPVHPGWPEMGIFANPEEGQQIFSAYYASTPSRRSSPTTDLQHALLRSDRAAAAGADDPGDAGTRTRGLPQAARVRVRPFVDAAVGGRTGRPLVERTIDRFATPSGPTWSKRCSCRSRSG